MCKHLKICILISMFQRIKFLPIIQFKQNLKFIERCSITKIINRKTMTGSATVDENENFLLNGPLFLTKDLKLKNRKLNSHSRKTLNTCCCIIVHCTNRSYNQLTTALIRQGLCSLSFYNLFSLFIFSSSLLDVHGLNL